MTDRAVAGAEWHRRDLASSLRLGLLVAEGYLYLVGSILVFVGVFALLAWGVLDRRPVIAVVALFLGVPLFLLILAILRALLFRVGEPSGVVVTREQAPALAAMIDEVRTTLRAPAIDRIIINQAFNASIVQTPLLWPRNYLVIGYPLLVWLSPEQLRTVIAHELAHLFHAHSRMAGWVHRTQQSWRRVDRVLNERGGAPIFVRWVIARYVPRLYSESTAISREQERLADHYAAQLSGSRLAAETLLAIDLGQHLAAERYWPALHDSVEQRAELPQPFAAMRQGLDDLAATAPLADALAELLEERDEPTHPSLRERLEVLDESPHVPSPPVRRAGEVYLGGHLAVVAARLDEDWQARNREAWTEHHADIRTSRQRLADIAALPEPTAETEFERATILEELEEEPAALEAFRAAVAIDPTHAKAALAVGRLTLDSDADAAVPLIERAMTLEPDLVVDGCRMLEAHFRDLGQNARAERHRMQRQRHVTRSGIARSEREQVTSIDRFATHDLGSETLGQLVAACGREPSLSLALLVRKHLRHSGGSYLVLGLVAGRGVDGDMAERLRAAGPLPADARIVLLDRDQLPLRHALEAVPQALVFDRTKAAA